MFKGKWKKLTRAYVSTVLTASMVLSLFSGGLPCSKSKTFFKPVSAYAETDPSEDEETSVDPTDETTTEPSEDITEPTTEPTDPSTVPSEEDPTEPSEETTSEPSEDPTEPTTESSTETSAPSESSIVPSDESNTEPTTAEPSDPTETTQEPSESSSEETTETSAVPSETETDPSETVSEPSESATESTAEPTSETTSEPSDETSASTSESSEESTSIDPTTESTGEPTTESTTAPSDGSTTETTTPGTEPSEPEHYESATLKKTITDSQGKKYSFTATYGMDSGLPKDAELQVKEIKSGANYNAYLEEAQAAVDGGDIEYVHLFDISIVKNGVELQPAEGSTVSMQIKLEDAADTEDLSVVHFPEAPGNGSAEVIENSTTTNGTTTTVEFEAESFSVYAIIDAPAPEQLQARMVPDLQTLSTDYDDSMGFFISYGSTIYITNTLNSNGAFVETSNVNAASPWYLEKASGANEYYVYTKIEGVKKYMKNTSGNLMGLSDNPETIFVISEAAANKFYFKLNNADKWLQHSGGGSGIRLWTDKNNATNSRMSLTYVSSVNGVRDYYQLDGKTYSITYHEESVKGAGLMAHGKTVNSQQRLTAIELLVRPNALENGELLVAKDSDLTDWTFECIEGSKYYITTMVGGTKKYLTLSGNNLTLVDTPTSNSQIAVKSGTGANTGKYNFSVAGRALTLMSGSVDNGFGSSPSGGNYSWVSLAKKTTFTEEDFVIYSAEKVSVSDTQRVKNGEKVVIYTRIWNDTLKRYEFYVVNYDGYLIRCYESGDMIQWVGNDVNTALWEFTEYLGDDGNPNYYYELQNTYSGKYIAPQRLQNQILSPDTIGVNLNGRRYGYTYTSILAWNEGSYGYSGLATNNKRLSVTDMEDAEYFFFAIIKPEVAQGDLNTVDTIDHTQYGITMKMIDYNGEVFRPQGGNADTTREQDAVLGNSTWYQTGNPTGLLSTNIDVTTDYPTAMSSGSSLKTLFDGGKEVNHLFIENTYFSSGYFEYDSTQNFASFYKEDGTLDEHNFTVYQQLGTNDKKSSNSMKHGQFLPYDKLSDRYASDNPYNLYDALLNTLPDSNPRKGEKLRLVEANKDTDYYFGMEIEATFTQTPSGKDAWGHDIIYEFTGDDDFWLYVDNELVIDLGGIHSALSGSVNYSTGQVLVDGQQPTTLRAIFENNYRTRNPQATEQEVKTYIAQFFDEDMNDFKDYSQHTMRIFYMERGGGASNLHMRFNLSSVKEGSVLLNKEITGVDDIESYTTDFPFQIQYLKKNEQNQDVEVTLEPDDSMGITVKYKDSINDVPFVSDYVDPAGGHHGPVFLLKPGEQAVISFPDEAIQYRIIECAIDTTLFDKVTANGMVTDFDASHETGRQDVDIDYMEPSHRNRVTFENHARPGKVGSLRFTKYLWDETGNNAIHNDDTTFNFRLYIGSENDTFDSLPLANLLPYHVLNEAGEYCRWDTAYQKFVSLGVTSFSQLQTAAERRSATFNTSMYGSISKIPVDYTVEIRDVAAGTKYKVEERYSDMPDGYSLKEYIFTAPDGTAITGKNTLPYGSIVAGETKTAQVHNLKGWGLRVHKNWTDADYMVSRDPVYMAVYYLKNDGTLSDDPIDGTVRQLTYEQDEMYWFFDHLETDSSYTSNNGKVPFVKYVVREVTLENAVVDTDGYVTSYSSIHPIKADGSETFRISGRQKGMSGDEQFEYMSKYVKGQLTGESNNVCVDTMTNKRKGIELYKTDKNWNPIEGAVFTLKDSHGNDAGAETYTSGSDGLITIAYLLTGEWYTLTEIYAPSGYCLNYASVRIMRDAQDGIHLEGSSDIEQGFFDEGEAFIRFNVMNTKSELSFLKFDASNSDFLDPSNRVPLSGVHFALYAQVIGSNGQPRRDYLPIPGFEDLYTDSTGNLPELTEAFANGVLGHGTYYLSEIEPLEMYMPLTKDILFTVDDTGTVELDDFNNPAGVNIEKTTTYDSNGIEVLQNLITIPNYVFEVKDVTVKKVVDSTSQGDLTGGSAFTYTARLYYPDGVRPWEYTNDTFKDGVASFTLTHDNTKVLKVPSGAVLTVVEDPSDWYTTSYKWNNGSMNNSSSFKQAILSNGTLTYTNTRNTVEVTVSKELTDLFAVNNDTFEFTFTGWYTDYGVRTDLEPFTIRLTKKNNSIAKVSKKLNIPYGVSLHIEEVLPADSVYSSDHPSGFDAVMNKNQTFAFKNVRKTATVTVSKELVDATATSAVPFQFTATLYKPDGTTVFPNYAILGVNGAKTDANGQVTFTLSPENGGTAQTQDLQVPYGAVLKVEEGVPTNGKTYTTTIDGVPSATMSATKTIGSSDSMQYAFVNTLQAPNEVNLTVSKTVAGSFGDQSEEFAFTITIESEAEGTQYTCSHSVTGVGTLTLDANHQATFTLAHGQSMTILGLPKNVHVDVTETRENYSTTWVLNGDDLNAVTGDGASADLASNAVLAVTNERNAVAPTGVSFITKPYLFLLLGGAALLIFQSASHLKKKKKEVCEDDGEM
ncbi:MAG: hypothetical protein J5752_04880 [Clostridiales bacterium]|nr:hypothetical protein [Clostridiales bacterium]